jgi:hypothetical protein
VKTKTPQEWFEEADTIGSWSKETWDIFTQVVADLNQLSIKCQELEHQLDLAERNPFWDEVNR